MVVPYIRAVQTRPVATTIKHYNLYNQETERTWINVHVGERAIQEIYTPPFEAASRQGRAASIMCSFNAVNGDYQAIHDTVRPANASLDMEMPGVGVTHFWGQALLQAVRSGQVIEETLNDKVRRILREMFRLGLFDPDADNTSAAGVAARLAQRRLIRRAPAACRPCRPRRGPARSGAVRRDGGRLVRGRAR